MQQRIKLVILQPTETSFDQGIILITFLFFHSHSLSHSLILSIITFFFTLSTLIFLINKNRAVAFFSDFVDTLSGSDFVGEEGEELYTVISNFSSDYDCLNQGQLLKLLALVCQLLLLL